MAFTEDMSVFFNTAEFAVQATFSPSGGGAQESALVILDAPSEPVLGGDSMSTEYAIQYSATDLPSIKRGDSGFVDGIAYKVREVRTIDDGRIKRAMLSRY